MSGDATRSISDDDVCSDCLHCDYHPGERSSCAVDWPGTLNEDGYVVSCDRLLRKSSEPHVVSEGGKPEDAAYWAKRNALKPAR